MSTLAAALKGEIEAAARRAAREQQEALRRSLWQSRAEVQELRRQLGAMERRLARLERGNAVVDRRLPRAGEVQPPAAPQLRFSAKGFAGLRRRLGLSAAAMGSLVGVTAQSVYKWEDGKARPRAGQLQAIAAVRTLGKREAVARLAQREAPARLRA
ncbi:helix-turn-helix transcriptional regulator [Ramlibacter sp. AN1015]|uniref:helix-turn-helix domain-containing protein n=1 Tax=Ramlibacter sp. AN1015 TaxID=3133428 RepID=UPI0030BF3F9D